MAGGVMCVAHNIPYFWPYLNILKYDVIFLKSLCFAKTGATITGCPNNGICELAIS